MKGKKFWYRAAIAAGILVLSAAIVFYVFYRKVKAPNLILSQETSSLYIPSNSDYNDVLEILRNENCLKNLKSFEWVAEKKNYPNHVHSGRYLIRNKMSNEELVNLLRSGRQTPVNVRFTSNRFLENISGVLGKQLEPDSADFINFFQDSSTIFRNGFTRESFMGFLIPNTYEFFWDTSLEEFYHRMYKEYKTFWNSERMKKAEKLGFSKTDVSTLASIVESETAQSDEMPIVAGVYINRLKKGIKLDADPTVIYGIGDFSIRRVLKKHLKYDSPYNTYLYKGLPPGPIRVPSITAIDAVLNYQDHNYLYFCAKEDFSGYHNFARSYREHRRNARKFQKALNEREIFK